MKGWRKCPSGRASDVRWASLKYDERGMLATIEDMADGLGSIPLPDGLEGLVAVLGGLEGEEVAERLVVRLVGVGAIALSDDDRRLEIIPDPTFTETLRGTAEGPAAPHDGPKAGEGGAEPPPRAAGPRRARAPQQRATNPLGLSAERWRKLRFNVQRRLGRFAELPPGTRLDDLLAPTSPWHALLAADGRKAERNGTERPNGTLRNGTERPNGTERNAQTERNGTPFPPDPPTPQREGENREKRTELALSGESARGTERPNGTERNAQTERNGTGHLNGTERPTGTGTEQRAAVCTTTERIGGGMLAAEVLMILRGAGLRLTSTTKQELELERVLVDVAARGQGWDRAGLDRIATHLRDGHATTRDGSAWRPTLAQLRGADGAWARLLSLYDEAAGCARCDGGHGPDGWDNSEDLASVRRRRREHEQAERGTA